MFTADASFEFYLTRTAFFNDRVLWLAPEPAEPFRRLTALVSGVFPAYPPYGGQFAEVIPNLTVGDHGTPDQLRAAQQAVRPHLPISGAAHTVSLMVEHADGQWKRRASFLPDPSSRSMTGILGDWSWGGGPDRAGGRRSHRPTRGRAASARGALRRHPHPDRAGHVLGLRRRREPHPQIRRLRQGPQRHSSPTSTCGRTEHLPATITHCRRAEDLRRQSLGPGKRAPRQTAVPSRHPWAPSTPRLRPPDEAQDASLGWQASMITGMPIRSGVELIYLSD